MLLDFLIAHHPAMYSTDELYRQFADPGNDPVHERVLLDEAVRILVGDGLAHRLSEFVFASHAAVAGGRLLT